MRLTFEQADGATKEARVPAGTTLFDAASWNGVAIDSTCGGHGTCKKCKVRVVSGAVPLSPVDPRAFEPDELRAGWRLACRAQAREDVHRRGPAAADPAEGGARRRRPARDPAAGRAEALSRARPSRHSKTSSRTSSGCSPRWTTSSCACRSTCCATRRDASPQRLEGDGGALRRPALAVEPGDTSARRFALAFDLGTTTVVANLLDLETGQPAAVCSMLNRQQPFGADVITRISAVMMDPEASATCAALAHETLPSWPRRSAREAAVDPARGVRDRRRRQRDDAPARARDRPRAALDGAVHDRVAHAAGGDRAPTSASTCIERAPAVTFPALGAYVGPDIVAGILATGLTLDRRVRLFIDVGTNSEIVLGSVRRGAGDGGAGRARLRGGADPLRDAGRRRRDRGGQDQRTATSS